MGEDSFSDTERKALQNFVTDVDADIYGVENVPDELFGAFGSFFSRNPRDVRGHILDAIKGEVPGYELGDGDERLERLARTSEALEQGEYPEDSDLRIPPATDLRSGVEKSREVFETWYGKYGHSSIGNLVSNRMVANDVSQLFARELADDQLAFFIEQSSRYVEFDEDNYYRDPDVMDSEHAELYEETIEEMLENYTEFTDIARDFYEDEIPFDEWLDLQDDETREKSDEFLDRKYDREIDGKSLDISRFLLPQAVQTNIAWTLDARSTENNIATWKGHPLAEMREAAEQIEEAAGDLAPSILKYTEENDYYGDKQRSYEGDLPEVEPREVEKGVEIISSPENSLDKVVAHILQENNTAGFQRCYEEARDMDEEEEIDVLERVTENRGSFDEWVGGSEEFDLEKIVFELNTDIGALRDIRRHQKNDRGENIYSLDRGFYRPEVIEEMPAEAQELFDETMSIAHEAEQQIREDFPHQAQYLLPMATMSSITMSMGYDQLQYMMETRSTPEGNFSYREDMFNLAEEVLREDPWILGLEEYPEDRDVREVYEESDWEGDILRLSTEETGLHT